MSHPVEVPAQTPHAQIRKGELSRYAELRLPNLLRRFGFGVCKQYALTDSSAMAARAKKKKGNPPMAPELKFLDTSFTDATLAATMVATNLNVVPQNLTQSGRVGGRIAVNSIAVRSVTTLIAATAVAATSAWVKWRVVLDKQTNKAAFGATDFLVTDGVLSYENLANGERFVTLAEWDSVVNAGGAAPSGGAYVFSENVAVENHYIPCRIPIEFDNSAATGAVGTQTKNSIWLVAIGASAEICSVTANCRIRFYDY